MATSRSNILTYTNNTHSRFLAEHLLDVTGLSTHSSNICSQAGIRAERLPNTFVTITDPGFRYPETTGLTTEMLHSAITRSQARMPLPKQLYALGQACSRRAAYNPTRAIFLWRAPALSVPGPVSFSAPSRYYSQYSGGPGGPGGPFPPGGTHRMHMSGK